MGKVLLIASQAGWVMLRWKAETLSTSMGPYAATCHQFEISLHVASCRWLRLWQYLSLHSTAHRMASRMTGCTQNTRQTGVPSYRHFHHGSLHGWASSLWQSNIHNIRSKNSRSVAPMSEMMPPPAGATRGQIWAQTSLWGLAATFLFQICFKSNNLGIKV